MKSEDRTIIQSRNDLMAWSGDGLLNFMGQKSASGVLEYFTARIRNRNTRMAYGNAVRDFLFWCGDRGLSLERVTPLLVAAHIEELQSAYSTQTVKQRLAAIRMLFDHLVLTHSLPVNPAKSVRGPKHSIRRGTTPVLTAEQARTLLDSIETESVVGLRDRALIGVMLYAFARVNAVVQMKVEDYFPSGKRWWFRLNEKGGRVHELPAHHRAETFLDAYIESAGIGAQTTDPLFRSVNRRSDQLTLRAMSRIDAWKMVRRRAEQAGINVPIGCHSFRATGITAYLQNGGSLEIARALANHSSTRTTQLYDRRGDQVTLDEIERILI